MDNLKKLLEFLSVYTLLFVFTSFCYQYYYYDTFGIAVNNYQTSAELAFSVLVPVFRLVSYASLALLFLFLLTFKKSGSSYKLVHDHKLRANIVLVVSLLGITTSVVLKLLKSDPAVSDWALVASALCLTIALYDIATRIYPTYAMLGTCFTAFALSLLLIRSLRRDEAKHVKQTPPTLKVSFLLNQKQVVTTSTFYPIGETQGYLFFYNKGDSSVEVFKKDKLDSLVYKETK